MLFKLIVFNYEFAIVIEAASFFDWMHFDIFPMTNQKRYSDKARPEGIALKINIYFRLNHNFVKSLKNSSKN